MNFKNLFVVFITIYLFTGCSFKTSEEVVDMSSYQNKSQQNDFNKSNLKYKKYLKTSKTNQKHPFDDYTNSNYITKKSVFNNELFDFYTQWEGVKYKMGGESKKGIDCSAFIQKAFKEKFDFGRHEYLQNQQVSGCC